jgi:NMD protein affecting ribosome stability and mRNA decay
MQTPSFRFLCPQCGSPTDGSLTRCGLSSSVCDDCVGDREIHESSDPLDVERAENPLS